MATRRLVVDRVEGKTAVVEVDGGEVVDLPLSLLPEGAGEGDVILLEARIDPEATRAARDRAAARLERLKKRDPGGDVVL